MKFPLRRLQTLAPIAVLTLTAQAHALERLPGDESPCFSVFEIELDAEKDTVPEKLRDALDLDQEGKKDPPQFRCLGATGTR